MTQHSRNSHSDTWSVGFVFPLFEIKPLAYNSANHSTGIFAVEEALLRLPYYIDVHNVSMFTVEYLTPDYEPNVLIPW